MTAVISIRSTSVANQPPPEQKPAVDSPTRLADDGALARLSGWLKSGGAALGATLRDALRVPKTRVDEQAELERRIEARQSLDDDLGDVGAEATPAARFVLAEVKDAVQRTREASRTVESKATSVVTLAVVRRITTSRNDSTS
jgi:hypothetical protein